MMSTEEKPRGLVSKILMQKGDPEEIELVCRIISLTASTSDRREVEQAMMMLGNATNGMRRGAVLMALLMMLDIAIDRAVDYLINTARARSN